MSPRVRVVSLFNCPIMAAALGFTLKQATIDGNKVSVELVEALRAKLKDVRVPRLGDEQLVWFLLSCDGDVEFAARTVVVYFECRSEVPQVFDGRDVDRPELLGYLRSTNMFAISPNRSPCGCAVVFNRVHPEIRWNQIDPYIWTKLLHMFIEASIHDFPAEGLILVSDMTGVGLMAMTKMNFSLMRSNSRYMNAGLPIKLKAMHVLNANYVAHKMLAFCRRFGSEEIFARIHTHTSDISEEDLFSKVLPAECLPSNYGGALPEFAELQEQSIEKLRSIRSYFEDEERSRHEYYDKA